MVETLTILLETYEFNKSLYEQLDRHASGIMLYRVTSRQSGRVTYHVGHIEVQPDWEHPQSGVVTPACEIFVSESTYDNEADGRNGLLHATLLLTRRQTADDAEAEDVQTMSDIRQRRRERKSSEG